MYFIFSNDGEKIRFFVNSHDMLIYYTCRNCNSEMYDSLQFVRSLMGQSANGQLLRAVQAEILLYRQMSLLYK